MKPGKLEQHMGDQGWITVPQAAEIALREATTIRRWIERGLLTSRRIAGRTFVERAAVERICRDLLSVQA